jgi:hypothetical protein
MAKNKKSPQSEDERGFKRIKEQRKPIKNFKTHLKDAAELYLEDEEFDEEDSIYYRERD